MLGFGLTDKIYNFTDPAGFRVRFIRDWMDTLCIPSAHFMGNSFGGIETVLGAEKETYCAAVDSAGAAQSWAQAPELQKIMTRAVRNARAPILFFQAENDYDLSPSRTLSAAIKESGKPFELRIYPPFGKSAAEGHSFGYFGSKVWGGDVFRFLNRYCR